MPEFLRKSSGRRRLLHQRVRVLRGPVLANNSPLDTLKPRGTPQLRVYHSDRILREPQSPGLDLLTHRLEVPFHSIHANRDGIDQRKDFECFASTGVNTPEIMFPTHGGSAPRCAQPLRPRFRALPGQRSEKGISQQLSPWLPGVLLSSAVPGDFSANLNLIANNSAHNLKPSQKTLRNRAILAHWNATVFGGSPILLSNQWDRRV
jgi:hypothetical protein